MIAASAGVPFDQIAPRLAPWLLLAAVRSRGEVPSEAQLAASIFGNVLMASNVEPPDPGSILSIDRSDARTNPFTYSIKLAPADIQANARKRAIDTAIERIERAWASGASLYIANLDAEDVKPLLRHAPDIVDSWLEGAAERSEGFKRRVRLAEGAFLALCEALLDVAPGKGALLWRSLKRAPLPASLAPRRSKN